MTRTILITGASIAGPVLKPFNIVLAPYTAPNFLGLADWQLTFDAGRDSCIIYTAPANDALRVCFGFPMKIAKISSDRAGQIALVRKNCARMGWQIPRLLDAMEAAHDFYLGPIAQHDTLDERAIELPAF